MIDQHLHTQDTRILERYQRHIPSLAQDLQILKNNRLVIVRKHQTPESTSFKDIKATVQPATDKFKEQSLTLSNDNNYYKYMSAISKNKKIYHSFNPKSARYTVSAMSHLKNRQKYTSNPENTIQNSSEIQNVERERNDSNFNYLNHFYKKQIENQLKISQGCRQCPRNKKSNKKSSISGLSKALKIHEYRPQIVSKKDSQQNKEKIKTQRICKCKCRQNQMPSINKEKKKVSPIQVIEQKDKQKSNQADEEKDQTTDTANNSHYKMSRLVRGRMLISENYRRDQINKVLTTKNKQEKQPKKQNQLNIPLAQNWKIDSWNVNNQSSNSKFFESQLQRSDLQQ